VKKVEIYPSLLSADFSRLGEQIQCVEEAGADGIHLDIMDGHFVPNITFGPVVVRSIRSVTRLPFWAHLMIQEPANYLVPFQEAGVQGIVIHAEIKGDPGRLSEKIHDLKLEAGVAINPETDAEAIGKILERFERVVIMTVHPGFGGQSFIRDPLRKIARLKHLAGSHPLIFEVDGGVDVHNAADIVKAGADVLVAGSAIFHSNDPAQALRTIRRVAEREL